MPLNAYAKKNKKSNVHKSKYKNKHNFTNRDQI